MITLNNNSSTFIYFIIAKITSEQLSTIQSAENKQEYLNEHIDEYDIKYFSEGIDTDAESVTFNGQTIPVSFDLQSTFQITDDGYYVVMLKKESCELSVEVKSESFNAENVLVKYNSIVIPSVETVLCSVDILYSGTSCGVSIKATPIPGDVYLIQKADEDFTILYPEE